MAPRPSKRARKKAPAQARGRYKTKAPALEGSELRAATLAKAADTLAGAELDPHARDALIQVWRDMAKRLEPRADAVRAWQNEIRQQASVALKAAEKLRALRVPLPDEAEEMLRRLAQVDVLPKSRPLLATERPPGKPVIVHATPERVTAEWQSALTPNHYRTAVSLLEGNWPNKEGMTKVSDVIRAEMDAITASTRKRK